MPAPSSCLSLPCLSEQATRWLCNALSVFATHGQLTSLMACDVTIAALTKHANQTETSQMILFAVGSLAETSPENQVRAIALCAVVIFVRAAM